MESALVIKSLLFNALHLFKVIVRSHRDIALPHSRYLYSGLLRLFLDSVQYGMVGNTEAELAEKL